MARIKLSENGFSLIEMLVAVAIMTIVSYGMTAMTVNVNREQKFLQDKFALLQLEGSVLQSFANAGTCLAQLNQGAPTLNLAAATTTVPAGINQPYTTLRAGSLPTSPILAQTGSVLEGTQIQVASIGLTDIFATGIPNEYRGVIQVAFDPDSTIRGMRPVQIRQIFRVAPPLTAATVVGCGGDSSTGSPVIQAFSTPTNTLPFSITVPANRCRSAMRVDLSMDGYRGNQPGGYIGKQFVAAINGASSASTMIEFGSAQVGGEYYQVRGISRSFYITDVTNPQTITADEATPWGPTVAVNLSNHSMTVTCVN